MQGETVKIRVELPVFILLTTLALAALLGCSPGTYAAGETFTIEDINDPGIKKYPVPEPVHLITFTFDIKDKKHEEVIKTDSKHLRTVSVTLENTGSGVIKSPYLFGPFGWDFRAQEALAQKITEGCKTDEEKFFRVHEWDTLYLQRCEGGIRRAYGSGQDPLLYINRYGHMMCGEHAVMVASIINCIKDRGELKARAVPLDHHETGEVFYDGKWRAFDASPGVRWIYFDYDNKTPATWKQICIDPKVSHRIYDVTGWKLKSYKLLRYDYEGRRAGAQWDFNYNLLPGESITMHVDMKGRVDRESYKYGHYPKIRTPCDYGSAVFTYRPDFPGGLYKKSVFEEKNINQTEDGLVPADPSKPSHVIIGINKYPWTLAGADIKAVFKTDGKVYAAAAASFKDSKYKPDLKWALLEEGKKEGLVPLEGKAAYWVKFEFQGKGSGLRTAEIKSEIQINRWTIPVLEYGTNRLRFEAEDMDGSTLKVTYRYDDKSPFYTYESAAGDYGRHIFFRVGGILHKTHYKPEFWKKLATDPNGSEDVTIKIFHAEGDEAFKKVRTLIDKKKLAYGFYKLYWDGKDDNDKLCEAGRIYCYRIYGGKHSNACERLYLFPKIWPVPNEIKEK